MQVPWRQLLFAQPPTQLGGMSQKSLVDHLLEEGYLRTSQIAEVLLSVRRDDFGHSDSPYNPSPTGHDQVISAFNVHAMACEALYPALVRPNARILDVGCGSGYLTAVFARLNPSATVYGIDCIPELVELSRININKHNAELLNNDRIKLESFDGSKGYPSEAPYDAIHVGAAAEKMPLPLLEQLKVGGMMLIPVGPLHVGQNYLKVRNP